MKLPPRFNPDWYRVKYSLAALHANRSASCRAEAAGTAGDEQRELTDRAQTERTLARRQATELVQACDQTLAMLGARLLRPSIPEWWARARALSRAERTGLQRFLLQTIEPPALVLLAGMLDPPRDPRAIALDAAPDHQALARQMQSDNVTDPVPLIAYVAKMDQRDPRTDYNLACVYRSWGLLDRTAEALERSVLSTPDQQQARLIDRAFADPTLNMWQSEPGKQLRTRLEKRRQELRARYASSSASSGGGTSAQPTGATA